MSNVLASNSTAAPRYIVSTRQHARIGHHVRTRSRRTPRGILLRHRQIRGERLRWKRTLRGGVTDEPPPLNPRGVLVTPRAPYGLTPSSGPQPPPPPPADPPPGGRTPGRSSAHDHRPTTAPADNALAGAASQRYISHLVSAKNNICPTGES